MTDQKNGTVTFKVALHNCEGKLMELRKFNIDKSKAEDFQNVRQRICHAFPTIYKTNCAFQISFKDSEGDNITISSDEELKFVTNPKCSALKLEVHLKEDMKSNAKVNGASATKGLKAQEVHKNFRCNECHDEIKGNRYRCVVCLDYDICSRCEPSSNHGHAMLKLPKPINSIETLVANACKILDIILSEEDCTHKKCSKCAIRRSCNGTQKEGSLNNAVFNLAKSIDQEVGVCGQCAAKPLGIENGQSVPIRPTSKPILNGTNTLRSALATMPVMRVSPMSQPIPGGPMASAGAMAQGPPLQYQPNFFPYMGLRPATPFAPPYCNAYCHWPQPPMFPAWSSNICPNPWEENLNPFHNSTALPASPSIPSPLHGSSQESSPKIEDESVDVQIQRAVLQLSAKGYVGDVEKLGEILRSVDLNVEKACKILDEEK